MVILKVQVHARYVHKVQKVQVHLVFKSKSPKNKVKSKDPSSNLVLGIDLQNFWVKMKFFTNFINDIKISREEEC